MKNRFFQLALAQASRLIGKPARLIKLATSLLHRLYLHNQRQRITVKSFNEQLQTFGRMIKAYARGEYRAMPAKTLISIIAAVLYFLNPFDLIPDAIIGIGLTDDLAVLTWVYKTSQQELNNFIAWEENKFSQASLL